MQYTLLYLLIRDLLYPFSSECLCCNLLERLIIYKYINVILVENMYFRLWWRFPSTVIHVGRKKERRGGEKEQWRNLKGGGEWCLIWGMFVIPYQFLLEKKRTTFCVYLHTSSGQEKKLICRKERDLESRSSRHELQKHNGATQSATCCTICKEGWVGIGHERFENSVLAGLPRSLQC